MWFGYYRQGGQLHGLERIIDSRCEHQVKTISPKDHYDAQREDAAINTLIELKNGGQTTSLQDRCRASPKVQPLLGE